MTGFIKRAPQTGRTIFNSKYESCLCLLLSVVARAKYDAMSGVEAKPPDKQERVDIIRDAIEYFKDGRYEFHMELMGRDPEVQPKWNGDK